MILQILSSSRGGAATHVGAIVHGLLARRESVGVVMPSDGGHLEAAALEQAGSRVFPWQGVRGLVKTLREVNPKVVHAHGSRAAWWAFLALLLAGSRARFIYSIHGFVTPFHPEPRRSLQLLAERLVGQRCATIIADARAERQEALRWGLAGPDKITVVYLGFALERLLALGPAQRQQARRELGFQESGQHVLCVCRLDRPRDFDTLLEGFAGLAQVDSRPFLHIVGQGPFHPRIEERIRALNLGSRVRLWGLVLDVVTFYAAADAFVLTSWGWEGCPVTVIEAQAAGLPAVVTNAGGSAEAMLPQVSGLLVERQSPQALGQALRQVLEEATRMGPPGREHARRQFGLEPMLDSLLKLYSRL